MSEARRPGVAKTMPDPIPASLYARPVGATVKAAPKRAWYRPIPGFRTGRRWKQAVAVCGYLLIGAWLLQTPSNPKLGLLGVLSLATVLLATNAWGIRSGMPVLKSGNPLVAGIGWSAIAIILIAAAAWEQPPTGPSSQSASSIVARTPASSPSVPVSSGSTSVPTATHSSNPTPSPTPSPIPTPTPTPTPKPSPSPAPPAETPITFVNGPLTASPGQTVTLYVKTSPGANCTITVNYASGPSTAGGLTPKNADGAGNVSWTWKVGTRTAPGSYAIDVSCGNSTAATTLHVT